MLCGEEVKEGWHFRAKIGTSRCAIVTRDSNYDPEAFLSVSVRIKSAKVSDGFVRHITRPQFHRTLELTQRNISHVCNDPQIRRTNVATYSIFIS